MGRRGARPVEDAPRLGFIHWSEIGPPDWCALRLFLTLTPGVVHTVRLIHRPVRFWRHVGTDRKCRIISAVEARKLSEEGVPGVMRRYAVNVLDRADGQVRILEGPEELFLEFRRCHELTGVELGGAEAFDFNVEVTGAGASRSYLISYDSERRTRFTPREKDAIRAGMIDLTTVFAARPATASK